MPRMNWFVGPFNARAGHDDGWYLFGHNAPVGRARDAFKPSTDSGSVLVSIGKKVLIWVWVSPWVTS